MAKPTVKYNLTEKRKNKEQEMSKPAIRNAIMAKAKKDGKSVTSNAVDTFIDTYKKTKVGPIQRAIGRFIDGINTKADYTSGKSTYAKANTEAQSNRAKSSGGRTASQVKATQAERNQRELAKKATKSPTGTVLSAKTKTRTAADKPKRMGGEVTYTGSGPKKPTTTSYKIKSGDTLSAIAARNETTVAALKKLNNIKDANMISAGASLKIPKKVRPSMPKSRPKRK